MCNILKNLTFQRHPKALVWSNGLKEKKIDEIHKMDMGIQSGSI